MVTKRVLFLRRFSFLSGLTGALLLGCPASLCAAPGGTEIRINNTAINLTVGQAAFAQGYVEATGLSGLGIDVKTDQPAGCTVRIETMNGGLQPEDLQVKSNSSGSVLNSYTDLSAPRNVWSTNISKPDFSDGTSPIWIDLKVKNLQHYPAGSHSNTLLLTVISN